MKAFLLSVAIMLVVALGAGYLLHSQFETSAGTAFKSDNVRLN